MAVRFILKNNSYDICFFNSLYLVCFLFKINLNVIRKTFLSFSFAVFSLAAFASSNVEKSDLAKVVSTENVQVCETRSSTIKNDETGESLTVSCTKCDEDPDVASAMASLCAYNGAKKLLPLIES